MVKKDAEFLSRLLATFKVEAGEHLKAIASGLLELEKMLTAGARVQLLEAVYREVHSLKGAARAVNLTEVETLCHALESVFASLKRKEMSLSPGLLDLLHEVVDGIAGLLPSPEGEPAAAARPPVRQLLQRLASTLKEGGSPPSGLEESPEPAPIPVSPAPVELKQLQAETVRIASSRLDSLLLQAEELLTAKLWAGQHAAELRDLLRLFAAWRSEWARIEPDLRPIQQSKVFAFLDWNHSHLKSLERRLVTLARSAEGAQRSLGSMVDSLLEDMKKAAMLPFSSLLEIFPKMVRQLARDQGKEVELVVQGEDIEIDRRILEELKDPLIHLVRNCIDHGIEKPEERAQKHKPERGQVTIAVSPQNGSRIEVCIADDGAGVDIEKVVSSAVKLGIIDRAEAEELDEREVLPLIFCSGVSASPIITDISGRGIGLAIVREKTEKIGGSVSLESHPGRGTSFRLLLPLTLATFRGILVQAGEQTFVVPAAHVERVVRVKRDDVKTVENKDTIQLNSQTVPLVSLDDVLELPRKNRNNGGSEAVPGFILGAADRSIAFGVDGILGEQEILVKTLGKQLSRVRNIAGATVLGDGRVVPILNVYDLVKSAVKVSSAPRIARIAPAGAASEQKSILVVEDSITARTLVKSILESVGYNVKTAVDGIDAYTELRSGAYDLVVSDVDMPRMNGFDLTVKIRADKKLADLPIVLVTALDSREDRERGVDVGANAYIVKSSFDQSNLLEVIRRLI